MAIAAVATTPIDEAMGVAAVAQVAVAATATPAAATATKPRTEHAKEIR